VSAPVLEKITVRFSAEDIMVRVCYRREDGPNPGTKARAREIAELVRAGLSAALQSIEGSPTVAVVGEAGFEVREDKIVVERKELPT